MRLGSNPGLLSGKQALYSLRLGYRAAWHGLENFGLALPLQRTLEDISLLSRNVLEKQLVNSSYN